MPQPVPSGWFCAVGSHFPTPELQSIALFVQTPASGFEQSVPWAHSLQLVPLHTYVPPSPPAAGVHRVPASKVTTPAQVAPWAVHAHVPAWHALGEQLPLDVHIGPSVPASPGSIPLSSPASSPASLPASGSAMPFDVPSGAASGTAPLIDASASAYV
jgi:hypothetical protein